MKKIINGKKYDTTTATLVAEWSNGYGSGDFHHCSEELYQKRTGEFFLFGEGGPLSKYAETSDGNNCYGERISLMDENEAKYWVMENCSADTYIELFGDVEE